MVDVFSCDDFNGPVIEHTHRLIDLRVVRSRLSPDDLKAHLAEGDAALLLACLVQVTGDDALLDRFLPHLRHEATGRKGDTRAYPAGRLPDEQLAELHKLLAEALTAEPSGPYLQVPDDALFHRLISAVTGVEVP